VTEHQAKLVGTGAGIDLDQLEAMADEKERLQEKIERLRWCLNLLLLDGFDRDELERLRSEVTAFTWRVQRMKAARVVKP
jgi:hypothetical protein